jgi:predicted nucleotidyltransferase
VTRLDLFGSAAGGEFDLQRSDLDLIVRFADAESPGIARRFFGLAEDLERLLERPVDLLMDQAFHNPYFAQTVAETRETIYEQ